MNKWAKMFGATCCACLLTGCATNTPIKDTMESQQQQSTKGEDFELQGIDGKTYRLSDYRGKKVYIKFWASWCSICLASLEETDQLANQEDFVVLSVVAPAYRNEKTKKDFTQWYSTLGYQHLPVLLDEGGTVMRSFNVRAYPSSVIIDGEGEIASAHIGYQPLEEIQAEMAQIQ